MARGGNASPEPSRWHASRRWLALAGVLLLLLALDLTRHPSRQLSARVLLAGIDLYQVRLAPWTAALGARCRFEPTCSHYAEAVIARHGAATGSWLTVSRIARCGPWTPLGTPDSPP